ncbi:8-oxo-dGTP pyrophosphatase MutT (NUDIX family) [Lipingzhangella halophila]|uniref:8-oxo-dGTP pyrophosphatase MutT (NUDIX family) n=1 Tax=Lipingzhangella halophila TaxID=1783352 RepID=A0A7W7W2Z5_9ACTN|nr:NUDIX hydrolase [Lipingzhangella halophila]MBB4931963.1 8-oxo-dGTP pyrophosphatase MutT (NUDIX family) [Lipingzhangella halophila]
MADTELEFFESLPRSRGAASALLRDGQGRLLLVKPTYKAGWSLPGGVIDAGESPLGACRRECVEELGFVPPLSGLVGVDWMPPSLSPDARPATVFVFAGRLRPGDFEAVRLPAEELSDAVLADPAEAGRYLRPGPARRVACAVEAARCGGTVYLEHGHPVEWGG